MGLKFTNPWWVVVGAVTGLFVCNGPVLGFTFGVFLKPIMADTGWMRSTRSFALSGGGILGAIAVPVLPDPVYLPIGCQVDPGLPRLPPPITLVPFISQIATSPLSFCHRMSE
jgi:hypothetical protein